MITFTRDGKKFIFRVAGVIFDGGRVLLHRGEHESIWALPGGRAEFMEPSCETIVREIREEISVEATVNRLLYTVENFFVYEGVECHEIGMYYLLSVPAGSPIFEKEEFYGDEGGTRFVFKWFEAKGLESVPLYPSFLRKGLAGLPDGHRHIIHRDEQNTE